MALFGIRTDAGTIMNETVYCENCTELEGMCIHNAETAEDAPSNQVFVIIANEDDAVCQGCGTAE